MRAKLAQFSIVGILITFFTELVRINSMSEFLSQVGSDKLPYVYIICSMTSPFIGHLVNQVFVFTKRYPLALMLYFSAVLGLFLCFYFISSTESVPRWMSWSYFIVGQTNTILAPMLISNLQGRYFNIFDAKQYFPWFNSADEFGALIAYGLISQFFFLLPVKIFFLMGAVTLSAIILSLGVTLRHRRIKYGVPAAQAIQPNAKAPQKTKWVMLFVLIVMSAALFEFMSTVISYQFNAVIEGKFESTQEINKFLANFETLASISIIICSFLFGRYLIPFTQMVILQGICALTLFVTVMGTALLPVVGAYYAAEFIRNLIACTLHSISFNQIAEGMASSVSMKLKNITHGFVAPLATVLASVILLGLSVQQEFSGLNYVMVATALIWIAAVVLMRQELQAYHSSTLSSDDEEGVIRSAQALGEYRNFSAVAELLRLLDDKNSILARKNSIISLGRIGHKGVMHVLFEQAYCKSEEVQQSAVLSIARYDSFLAQRFLIDFLSSTHCKSLLVRENLIKALHRTMGSSLVPILLPFLESKDPRVVANTIESMSETTDRRVIEILKPKLNSDNNRVSANTILVLYKFRSVRSDCEEALLRLLTDKNLNHLLSFIYVVGRLKLYRFSGKLRSMRNEGNYKIHINVAFALSNMGYEEGYALFAKILRDAAIAKQSFHHFLQLPIGIRFRIIDQFLVNDPKVISVKNLVTLFMSSDLDFHEEVETLQDYIELCSHGVTAIRKDSSDAKTSKNTRSAA